MGRRIGEMAKARKKPAAASSPRKAVAVPDGADGAGKIVAVLEEISDHLLGIYERLERVSEDIIRAMPSEPSLSDVEDKLDAILKELKGQR